MHTKKYRASPLTDKKIQQCQEAENNIEQTENLPPPQPSKSNGPSLIETREPKSPKRVLCN
jgi:hypothetical protein